MGRYKLAGFFGVIWFDLRALNSRVEGSPHQVVPASLPDFAVIFSRKYSIFISRTGPFPSNILQISPATT